VLGRAMSITFSRSGLETDVPTPLHAVDTCLLHPANTSAVMSEKAAIRAQGHLPPPYRSNWFDRVWRPLNGLCEAAIAHCLAILNITYLLYRMLAGALLCQWRTSLTNSVFLPSVATVASVVSIVTTAGYAWSTIECVDMAKGRPTAHKSATPPGVQYTIDVLLDAAFILGAFLNATALAVFMPEWAASWPVSAVYLFIFFSLNFLRFRNHILWNAARAGYKLHCAIRHGVISMCARHFFGSKC
jgi:hypothetical protein